jgi:hypothetical protein
MDVCLTEYNEVETQNAFIDEGEDRLADLYRILKEKKRYDDLDRSMYDKIYRKQLMSELLD